MSLTNEQRKILVQREYEKALKTLHEMRMNAKMELWTVVANRLYYSMFHAVSALLIKDGHEVKSHKGAIMNFGLYYVTTGVFPTEYGQLLSRMETLREKADYSCVFEENPEMMKENIPIVEKFIMDIGTEIGVPCII